MFPDGGEFSLVSYHCLPFRMNATSPPNCVHQHPQVVVDCCSQQSVMGFCPTNERVKTCQVNVRWQSEEVIQGTTQLGCPPGVLCCLEDVALPSSLQDDAAHHGS